MQPINFGNIQKPTIPIVDATGNEEDVNWAKQQDAQDGKHGLALRNLIFKIAKCFIILVAILMMVMFTIWFWHLVAPNCWKWLNHNQVQGIERILFASTLLSVAGRYFSKFKLIT